MIQKINFNLETGNLFVDKKFLGSVNATNLLLVLLLRELQRQNDRQDIDISVMCDDES